MINDSRTTEKEKFAKFNSRDDMFDEFYFHTLPDLHPELKKIIKSHFESWASNHKTRVQC